MAPARLCLACFAWLLSRSTALVWPLQRETVPTDKIFIHSEYWVYASDHGPWPVSKGRAYVSAKLEVAAPVEQDANATRSFVAAHVQTKDLPFIDYVGIDFPEALHGICCDPGALEQQLNNHSDVTVSMVQRHVASFDPARQMAVAEVDTDLEVRESSLQSFILCACAGDDGDLEAENWEQRGLNFTVDGTVAYHNPYGFFRAIYFGEIPFEFARFLGFLIYGVFFVFLMERHKQHLQGLHYAVAAVLFVGTLEAMCWFTLYAQMNDTGTPRCCPFPAAYGAAVVFEVLRATASRAVLLLLSVGLWVVRDRLEVQETLLFLGLVLSFAAVGIAYNATEMRLAQQKTASELWIAEQAGANLWQVPWVLLNVGFLSWIYLALTNMMQLLEARGQTYKLSMYLSLFKVVIFCVGLFVVMFVVFALGAFRVFQYPWTLMWWDEVAWKVLNFLTVVAVSWIWRPNERTFLLSLSSQLPTEDNDDDAFSARVEDREVEMGGLPAFSILPSVAGADEDDDDDLEGGAPAGFQGSKGGAGTGSRADSRVGERTASNGRDGAARSGATRGSDGAANGRGQDSGEASIFDDMDNMVHNPVQAAATTDFDVTFGDSFGGAHQDFSGEDDEGDYDGVHIGRDEARL